MARRGGAGRRWAPRAAAALVALALAAACGSGGGDAGAPPPPARTIAILRAVFSGQAANQDAFLDELARVGYVEGDNLTVLGRDLAEVHAEPADAEATVRAWVDQGADLVVALSTSGARAAAAAAPGTTVLFLVNDPKSAGLVAEPRRPDGRLTGVTFRVPPDRTLDLARRALPEVGTLAIVYPPADPAALAIKDAAVDAAADLAVPLVEATFTGEDDAAAAVAAAADRGAQALWALNSPTTARFSTAIEAAAADRGLPLIANTATATAVVVLQPDAPSLYRQLARQAVRLLAGTPVVEVPVENPGRFVTEVNLAVAARLGVTVSPGVVAAADTVVPVPGDQPATPTTTTVTSSDRSRPS